MFDDELREEFRAEGLEHLDLLEAALLRIDNAPSDSESVAQAFRSMHSLKGSAGFLQRPDIEQLTHQGEELLEYARSGGGVLDHDAVSSLLKCGDACRRLLDNETATDEAWIGELVETLALELTRLKGLESEAPRRTQGDAATAPDLGLPEAQPLGLPEAQPLGLPEAQPLGAPESQPRPPQKDAEAVATTEAPQADKSRTIELVVHPKTSKTAASSDTGGNRKTSGPRVRAPSAGSLAERRLARKTAVENLRASATAAKEAPSNAVQQARGDSSIRVDVTLLDELMNLVGELVVSRNRLNQTIGVSVEQALKAARRIDQLTSELQSRALKTRMRPIAAAWATLPRTVRELSSLTGKEVRLVMTGHDTELDRGLLEIVKDPLVHMVRNAVDHGLETREERREAGKPGHGTLSLLARHSGGMVVLEVSDDGRGLNAEKLREKAVQRGITTAQHAMAMSDAEAYRLVFHPGLSTAETVSRLSGRGVGMDVVRASIGSAGGTVEVDSVRGQGTTFTVKLPLTLAIVPALVIVAGGMEFCIQENNLVEIVDLIGAKRRERLTEVAGAKVFRLRDELLPLVDLSEALALGSRPTWDGALIVVVEADALRYGLVIDRVAHSEDVVVKPIGKELKQLNTYAGATVRGDGEISLFLDVPALGRRLGVKQIEAAKPSVEDKDHARAALAVNVGAAQPALIPLEAVLRTYKAADLELQEQGDSIFTLFEGNIIPVLPLEGHLDSLVVCEAGTRRGALGVSSLHDVLSFDWRVTEGIGPPWCSGMTHHEGVAMAIIDVPAILKGGR